METFADPVDAASAAIEILGVHVHHEVGVCSKERHLTFRVATIGAMHVGLDELPDSEAIRGFVGGEGNVFAHELASVF
jgi:hypothetical protein